MPNLTGLNVQIFGIKSSSATRAAERFFKERNVPLHVVDLQRKPMSPGEIRRFVEKFGLPALLDTDGKTYLESGLKYLKVSEAQLLERIEHDPKLLRLPFVRCGKRISMGQDEDSWKAMLKD